MELQHLRNERLYRAIMAKIKDLPLDQFIDYLATRKEFDTTENWERLHGLAQVMVARAGQFAERNGRFPGWITRSFRQFENFRQPVPAFGKSASMAPTVG